MKAIEMSQNTANTRLCFIWTEDELALIISLVDDNTIVGDKKAVANTKKALRMAQYDCEE